MLTMVPMEQPYPQDTCEISLSGFLLWGWQKLIWLIKWRSSDLRRIASSLSYYVYVVPSPKILLLSRLLFPKVSTLVD